MNKNNFSLLSLEDQLIILKTEAEELTKVPSLANEITLYSYNGYLVEEYRNRKSNELVKIETLNKENEAERLKVYSMYIDFINESLNFKDRDADRSMITCLCCEYEWFPEPSIKINDVFCPVCQKGKWTFLYKTMCKGCSSIYYSGVGQQKRLCPKCK